MVTPVYETMPGWKESTFGITEFDKLPVNARNYVRRLEELAGVKIAILSTGPERDQTIYIEDPFAQFLKILKKNALQFAGHFYYSDMFSIQKS